MRKRKVSPWAQTVEPIGWFMSTCRQVFIFIVLMAVLWFILSEVMGWQVLSYKALGFQGWCTFR